MKYLALIPLGAALILWFYLAHRIRPLKPITKFRGKEWR